MTRPAEGPTLLQQRSPLAAGLLSFLTLGLYSIVWLARRTTAIAQLDPDREDLHSHTRRGIVGIVTALGVALAAILLASTGFAELAQRSWLFVVAVTLVVVLAAYGGFRIGKAAWGMFTFVEEHEGPPGSPAVLGTVPTPGWVLVALPLLALAAGVSWELFGPWSVWGRLGGPAPADPFSAVLVGNLLLVTGIVPFATARLQLGLNRIQDPSGPSAVEGERPGTSRDAGRIATLTVATLGHYVPLWLLRATGEVDRSRSDREDTPLRARVERIVVAEATLLSTIAMGLTILATVALLAWRSGASKWSQAALGPAMAVGGVLVLLLTVLVSLFVLVHLFGLLKGLLGFVAEGERAIGHGSPLRPIALIVLLVGGPGALAMAGLIGWWSAFQGFHTAFIESAFANLRKATPLASLPVLAYVVYRCQSGLNRIWRAEAEPTDRSPADQGGARGTPTFDVVDAGTAGDAQG